MTMSVSNVAYRPSNTTIGLSLVLALVGGSASVLAGMSDPSRFWANLLLMSNYLVGIGLGSAVLLALFYVTGASWSVVLRRVPEAMIALMVLGGAGLAAVLLAYPSLYPWNDPVKANADSLSPFQSVWLTRPLFLARSFAYFVLWIAFAFVMVRNSRRQDQSSSPSPMTINRGTAALFLVLFAVTCWLSATDWLMSLEPNWSSTIFGVYHFAGVFLGALAAVCVTVIALYWAGPMRQVLTKDHLHDLGTLLFGFSSFWMYIWFSQYLLIWYVNNPEEIGYYQQRLRGEWQTVTLVNLGLNWAIPFIVLLFRSAKRSPMVLFAVAGVVLAGRWLDLYLLIFPSLSGSVPQIGMVEAGVILASLGLGTLIVVWSLSRAPLVPKRDPLMEAGHEDPAQPVGAMIV
jgi:hypothetical protein